MGSNPTLSAISLVRRRFALASLAAMFLAAGTPAPAAAQLAPELEAFIQDMARKHRFSEESLRRLFAKVEPNQAVVNAMTAPLTALPWFQFRSRYVDAVRINGGLKFWREHADTLARARREFGVPEEIIVATIGVESIYGRRTGSFGVLEALTMLAFSYPPRAQLFRSELEHFLLLTREARLDALRVKGSYAGAIGIPQFLPSSYRRYAVDFDGDGRRDLMGSVADAIGSVANYYKAHGWRAGQIIAVPAAVEPEGAAELLGMGIKPRLNVGELKRRGVSPAEPLAEESAAALVVVEAEEGPTYWLGLNNFYVITRYNRSINYALAIRELARELRAQYGPES